MSILGRLIYILHPVEEYRNALIARLRKEEFEAFGFDTLNFLPGNIGRDEIVFIYVGDHKNWDWRSYVSALSNKRKKQSLFVALGQALPPEGFLGSIQEEDPQAYTKFRDILGKHGAKGQRHFVRFGNQRASLASFGFSHKGRHYKGVIQDISIAGFSCFFSEEPSILPSLTFKMALHLPHCHLLLPGSFVLQHHREGKRNYVFRFATHLSENEKNDLHEFIYACLHELLMLEGEGLSSGEEP